MHADLNPHERCAGTLSRLIQHGIETDSPEHGEYRHAGLPGTGRVGLVDGLIERPDGNNVSMDRESLNMAEAQLQFRTGIELLKRESARVMDAIHVDTK